MGVGSRRGVDSIVSRIEMRCEGVNNIDGVGVGVDWIGLDWIIIILLVLDWVVGLDWIRLLVPVRLAIRDK